MSELLIEEIEQILPHRYPFLLIDRVLSYTDETIVALKNVTYNEPHFVGHFPSFPVMPGVLLVEAMAQAAGVLAVKALQRDTEENVFLLAGVERARFKRMVKPGDQVIFHVTVQRKRARLWKFSGYAQVSDQRVCEADFSIISEQ